MILLTGGTGQVGRSILAHDKSNKFTFIAPSRDELNLSDVQSIHSVLASRSWDAVVNAGAYTAVDHAENEPILAQAINAKAPTVLANYCQKHSIPLIHFSTDYVFDGNKPSPYIENDITGPIGVYGKTKHDGERGVLSSGCKAVILRTAWVVSPFGKNFINTMLTLAHKRDEIRVVSDQHGCPTGASDIANTALSVLEQLLFGINKSLGLYHCVNQGETTWAGLARSVMAESAILGGPTAKIIDISSNEYPTPAKRPHNSRLLCDKLNRDWNITLRPWQPMVAEIVALLLQKKDSF